MNADERSRYFQELTRNLQHEGLSVKPGTGNGLLPAELEGHHRPLWPHSLRRPFSPKQLTGTYLCVDMEMDGTARIRDELQEVLQGIKTQLKRLIPDIAGQVENG